MLARIQSSIMWPTHRIAILLRIMQWGICVSTIFLGVAAWPVSAFAYRPFDGTDAAVAEPGEVEIEFQPAGVIRDPTQRTLIAPATVINFGLSKDWEAILQGQFETPLSPSGPSSLSEAGVFLKHVLRPGSLQDKPGPSIATEFGVLLPDTIGGSGYGASVAGIVSQRWDWGAIHLNVAGALTRDQHADLFTGIIVEGPSKWTVRPVAEIFYEEEFGQLRTTSGLVGVIWQINDKLSFDVGVRHAITSGHSLNEVRAGLTFGFPITQFLGGNRK
jgi:hypothetical protein